GYRQRSESPRSSRCFRSLSGCRICVPRGLRRREFPRRRIDMTPPLVRLTGRQLVTAVCAAQVLVQIGAFFWPVLLPTLVPVWRISNGQAGWITGIFYLAYM